MNPLFDQLVAFFEGIGWTMVQVPNETILSVNYRGKNGQWTFVASAEEAAKAFVFFSRAPMSCPPDRVDALVTFLNRVNFGLTMGAWAVDPGDGEIRFRYGIDVRDSEVTSERLRRATMYTVLTLDHHLKGLEGLTRGDLSPEAAWNQAFSVATA